MNANIQLLKSITIIILLAFLWIPTAQAEVVNDLLEIQDNHINDKSGRENQETLMLSKTNLSPRVPSKSAIENYNSQYRFKYKIGEEPVENISWFNWIFIYIFRFFFYLMSIPLVRILLIIIIVALILWRLVKMGLIDTAGFSGKRKLKRQFDDGYNILENDLEHNYDKLISDAVSQKNYRLAIRLLFLKNLKILSDREMIVWDKKKTNNNYIYEISDGELRKKYAQNSLIFDYVWYGEFEIDEADYAIIHQQYDEFYKNVRKYAVP